MRKFNHASLLEVVSGEYKLQQQQQSHSTSEFLSSSSDSNPSDSNDSEPEMFPQVTHTKQNDAFIEEKSKDTQDATWENIYPCSADHNNPLPVNI